MIVDDHDGHEPYETNGPGPMFKGPNDPKLKELNITAEDLPNSPDVPEDEPPALKEM
jgi:hypothetical protein